jgi:putative sigma-54 modulation protein
MEGHGHFVRAKVAAHDRFVAVDRAVDKLEHQLHKLKTKLQRRTHPKKGPSLDSRVSPIALDTDATNGGDGAAGTELEVRIVKTKRFSMKPMPPEEALQHMDLLGHGFFFFTNAETSRAAVVYRRSDGDVGLIDEAD